MKQVLGVFDPPERHWVGDGFPVRSLFSYDRYGAAMSPFLLLDYAGPAQFAATDQQRGVGEHPHRGFETVTIVYQGEVAHRDSTGQGGVIGPGDVQWMTAGSGILHEEFHSPAFAKAGGPLEMVQLWVNLPAKDKLTEPRYQGIQAESIPQIALPDDSGSVRVIAGSWGDTAGAAKTVSPMHVWDMHLSAHARVMLPLPEGWSASVVVRQGQVQVDDATAAAGQWVLLSQEGQNAMLTASDAADVLVLAGKPLNEPIVGHGPFVMNSREEIIQAVQDFNGGQFGRMPR